MKRVTSTILLSCAFAAALFAPAATMHRKISPPDEKAARAALSLPTTIRDRDSYRAPKHVSKRKLNGGELSLATTPPAEHFSPLLTCAAAASVMETQRTFVASEGAVKLSELRFTENLGQVADFEGKTRPDILYTTDAQGAQIYFHRDRVSYVFSRSTGTVAAKYPAPCMDLTSHAADPVQVYRMDMVLTGCRSNALIRAEYEMEGYSNYYYSHCPHGITNVKSYACIVYENIYDRIDLVFRSGIGRMKYEFVVHPGGKPEDIRLRYEGATALRIDESGKLLVETPLGGIEEAAPHTYHDSETSIASSFSLHGSELCFEIASYDSSRALIIDPWATYYGGNGNTDKLLGAAVDNAGDYLIVGSTNSTNFPISYGWQTSNAGNSDICLIKLSAARTLHWSTYYGGTSGEESRSVAVGANNTVTICGWTMSSNFPVTANAYQSTFAGGTYDGIIATFNSSGSRVWGTFLGGTGDDGVWSAAYDTADRIYLTGSSGSSNFPVTAAAFQTAFGGVEDAFLICFSSPAASVVSIQWSTFMGGNNGDRGRAVACRGNTVAVCGMTYSTNFPVTAGAFQSSHAGGYSDSFVASFTPSGTLQWSTYLGGNSMEDGRMGIGLDASGNCYVSGYTESADFPTAGAIQSTYGGSGDIYITKFGTAGATQWSTYYGGSEKDGWESGGGFTVDASGACYAVCLSQGSSFPVYQAYQSSFGGGTSDIAIVKLNGNGTRAWATYYGGLGWEQPEGIAVDPNGFIVICGYAGTLFPLLNPLQSAYAGGNTDGFIMQMTTSGQMGGLPGVQISTSAVSPSAMCAGSALQVSFTATGSFAGNNVFTAQLSNAATSFNTPAAIGTLPGSAPGAINCVIPANTPYGTGYRIRVVSSDPAANGSDNGSNLTISAKPSAAVSPAGVAALCPGATALLLASYGIGYTYQWLFNGVDIPGATADSHNATSPGFYAVVVRNAASCADTSAPVQVIALSGDTTHLVWTGNLSRDWSTPGNWDHPCSTPGPGDTVVISGMGQVPLVVPSVNLSMLKMDNQHVLRLGGELGIGNALVLSRGSIDAGSYNIALDAGASIYGGDAASHIITSGAGKLVRKGIGPASGALCFPVGADSATYSPLLLENSGVSDDFQARVEIGVRTGGNTGAFKSSNTVNRTWHINEVSPGGSNATLTAQWEQSHELAGFLRNRCMLHRHDGSIWLTLQPAGAASGGGPYTRSVSGLTAFSIFAVSDSLAGLPVELLRFSAYAYDRTVDLSWRTASERNNTGFRVERASSSYPDWDTRGFVAGSGYSNMPVEYHFTDYILETDYQDGKLRYRLRQIDTDGMETLSPEIEAVAGVRPSALAVSAVYPNPLRGSSLIVICVPEEQSVTLSVFNTLGRQARVLQNERFLGPGTHIVPADFSGLSAGAYYLRLSGKSGSAEFPINVR